MIRDTTKTRVATRHRSHRRDGPELKLPRPHFDATQSRNVLNFLDEANRTLLDRNANHELIGQTIWQICGVLHLRRQSLSTAEWHEFIQSARATPLCATLHEDAFTHRAFVKPRGYSGDAVLLDFIYGTEHFWAAPDMGWVGQRVFRWSTLSSACQGVKSRRAVIADRIDEVTKRKVRPRVLSLASGHLREAELSSSIIRKQLGTLLAVDSDKDSLLVVDTDYGRFGAETIHASARELISGKLDCGYV